MERAKRDAYACTFKWTPLLPSVINPFIIVGSKVGIVVLHTEHPRRGRTRGIARDAIYDNASSVVQKRRATAPLYRNAALFPRSP